MACRTLGLILAGGRSQRMGSNDKGLIHLAGEPLIAHVARRFAAQCEAVAISANGPPERYAFLNLPVLHDASDDRPGPLAGLDAGLAWASRQPSGPTHLATVPVDAPFLPLDFVARLAGYADLHQRPVCASTRGRNHPVAALWPLSVAEAVRIALRAQKRRVTDLLDQLGAGTLDWSADPVDPFFNVNTPADLDLAERLIGSDQP